jgi:hypothetical protein
MWKADVQQDQVGLQFLSLPNGLYAITNFSDDLQFLVCQKRQADEAPPRLEIVHYENPDN